MMSANSGERLTENLLRAIAETKSLARVGARALFQTRDLFHQALIERVGRLFALRVVALIAAPEQIAAYADANARQFLALGVLKDEAAVHGAPSSTEAHQHALR